MTRRPTPFELVFADLAAERFPRIRESLAAARLDPADLEAFVLDREVVALLRELVPEDRPGEAIRFHLSLLHHAYLYWRAGQHSFRLTRPRTAALLVERAPALDAEPPGAYYIQFPERMLWSEVEPGQPHEPLDGAFVRPWSNGGLFVLAIFGLHPSREGFSVVETEGYLGEEPRRADGSASFSPLLAGGAAAGLHSLADSDELLELAFRTRPLAVANWDRAAPGESIGIE